MKRRLLALGLAVAVGLGLPALGAASGSTAAAATPTIAQLIGQKLMVRIEGTTASPALIGRIQRGEIGGVILFGQNIVDATQVKALTKQLHDAAINAGRPRLLIAVDQEGGSIKRIPWAPPTLSPPQMGKLGSTATARSQGASTGKALADLGIDIDLAPVADVPFSTASFLYLQGRTWSFDSSKTAWLSWSFAQGLETGGVVPVMKHFPGLGYATKNTDTTVVAIRQSVTTLNPGLQPYRVGIRYGLPMVMLSNATYPAWDPIHPAGWSAAIGTTLLRTKMGFRGVTITDSLDGTAAARGMPTSRLALRACQAGTDMLLLTGSEASSSSVYASLVQAAQSGQVPLAGLRTSYARIEALKAAG